MPTKKDFKGYYRVLRYKQNNSPRNTIINTITKGYNRSKTIVWDFSICDTKLWPFCVNTFLLNKLKSLNNIPLQDLIEETHGRQGKSSNHYIRNKSYLCAEARKRLSELNLYRRKHFFSLRVNGKVRIYGFLYGNLFQVLWLDKNHKIYPTDLS